jgi:hypothetical protein
MSNDCVAVSELKRADCIFDGEMRGAKTVGLELS